MRPGARTPEELESLLEDAFVTQDAAALCEMFEEGAVLIAGPDRREARGGEQIRRTATALWEGDRTYVAELDRVVQARDTALVLGNGGISVVRRARGGDWRYAIALLADDHTNEREEEPMTQQTDTALQPMKAEKGEGEARWWFGALAEFKATAADTGGRMTIVEVTEHPGAEAPLHVHHRDDEGFWILEGEVTFEVGDQTIPASAGDYVFGPRGIPHRFTVGDQGCRMLFILVPGGIEEVIRATSEPAGSRTLPPPPEREPTPEEMEQLKAVIREHGYELLA
jgi:quercetin dioxygenase-like cupin family protein